MSARSSLLSTLLTFHVRLWLGGFLTAGLVPLSLGAAALNFVSGLGPDAGPYDAVHALAVRLDARIRSIGSPTRQRAADSAAVGRRTPASA